MCIWVWIWKADLDLGLHWKSNGSAIVQGSTGETASHISQIRSRTHMFPGGHTNASKLPQGMGSQHRLSRRAGLRRSTRRRRSARCRRSSAGGARRSALNGQTVIIQCRNGRNGHNSRRGDPPPPSPRTTHRLSAGKGGGEGRSSVAHYVRRNRIWGIFLDSPGGAPQRQKPR